MNCYFSRLCLKVIPHEKFSFAKIWLLAAQFEIRQLNLQGARLTLGAAIGKAPKDKVASLIGFYFFFSLGFICVFQHERFCFLLILFLINIQIFKKYIEIELQLGNIDRCRTLYEKYLEWSPENCYAWSKYAELERSLAETERARSIFELAIDQPALDMPELLWKVFHFNIILISI
mgnify:CR=1 FL=1